MNIAEKSLEFTRPRTTYADTLRFTAYAYAKLLWLRDRGDTEIAGYATTETNNPLLITDLRLIKQKCTSVTFDLDPGDLAEDVERTLDMGLMPWQANNILWHTHPPGCNPTPSLTDEENFVKAFSHPDWAVMLIIAKNGSTYCRLKINTAPGVEKLLKVEVDWTIPFGESNAEAWNAEYKDKVTVEKTLRMTGKELGTTLSAFSPDNLNRHPWWDNEEQGAIGFTPNQQIEEQEDESEFDCFWDTDGNAIYWDEEDSIFYTYDPLNHLWYRDSDEDESIVEQIEMPKEPWSLKVIEWANKYASERGLALIEEEVCDSGKEG